MMMEAVRTSEMSVYSNESTRIYIPEYSKLPIRRRENLKSHIIVSYLGCLSELQLISYFSRRRVHLG
jgi:hypothetical protein